MITSTTNSHVKHIKLLTSERKERRREQLFVIEGVRLVTDALASKAEVPLVLYAPEQLAANAAGAALLAMLEQRRFAYPATPQVLAAAADTISPQGVVGLARWPELSTTRPGIILIFDGIQDPGNAGTLLRSAEACGVVQVLAARGSVDLYSPKVVRAAMSAHFRLPMMQDLEWQSIGEQCATVDTVYTAEANATMPYYAADWRQPSALIISNEANGVSDQAAVYTTRQISIPMRGGAESLNAAVAGSVILFEALRQRMTGRGG